MSRHRSLHRSWTMVFLVLLLAVDFTAMVGIAGESDGSYPQGGLNNYVLLGVRGNTANLVRYDFAQQQCRRIGTIRDETGQMLTGIDAMGYVPGNLNLFAFWSDSAGSGGTDELARLMYVNCLTSTATAVGAGLGKGRVTAATVAYWGPTGQFDTLPIIGPNDPTPVAVVKNMRLFAVQLQDDSVEINGKININLNNREHIDFELITEDDTLIRIDDLNRNSSVQSNGVYFSGYAKMVKVRLKGNRNNNDLMVDNKPYPLDNSKTYIIKSDDMQVSLYNDHLNRKRRATGHWWIDINATRGTVNEGNSIHFDLDNGQIIPVETYAAKVTVLGAAIAADGKYDIPVTVGFKVGDQYFTPFGDPNKPVDGGVNDGNNPRHFVFPQTCVAADPITVFSKSWIKKMTFYSGKRNSHWKGHMTVDSLTDCPQVLLLRDGDPVPKITPFINQRKIEDFIKGYVNMQTNTVMLNENQAIYLFELGTNNLNSTAADFQDLVILVTLGKDPQDFIGNNHPRDDTVSARLIKVDPKTGAYEQLMSLSQPYDSLAADGSGDFHATVDQDLWRIDPVAQTETRLGTMQYDQIKGMDFAGSTLCGFTVVNNRLVPMDALDGTVLGDPINILAEELTSIVFIREPDVPHLVGMD